MPPRFSWSFSAINDFDTCPALYAAKRFYKTLPYQETEHTIWGDRVHKSAEDFFNGKMPEDQEAFRTVSPFCLEHWERPFTERLTEFQMCVTNEWKPAEWYGHRSWGRGIIDLCIINGDHAHMVDYKTGKMKEGDEQLRIFAVLLAILKPELQHFTGEYDWTKTGGKTHMKEMSRKDLLPVIVGIREKVQRMEEAWRHEVFPARRNGLCRKWCGNTDCTHCGG